MYEYLIIYSYWNGTRRVKEKDTFIAENDQQAVDHCREFNFYLLTQNYGRIESVYRDTNRTWEVREKWE